MHREVKMAKLARIVDGGIRSAIFRTAGLTKQPDDPAYNRDAARPPEEWSESTRAAIILARGAAATGRPGAQEALDAAARRWPALPGMKFGRRRKPAA